jgi:hypothetical protein
LQAPSTKIRNRARRRVEQNHRNYRCWRWRWRRRRRRRRRCALLLRILCVGGRRRIGGLRIGGLWRVVVVRARSQPRTASQHDRSHHRSTPHRGESSRQRRARSRRDLPSGQAEARRLVSPTRTK